MNIHSENRLIIHKLLHKTIVKYRTVGKPVRFDKIGLKTLFQLFVKRWFYE